MYIKEKIREVFNFSVFFPSFLERWQGFYHWYNLWRICRLRSCCS